VKPERARPEIYC